jgi:hypothetical protein
MKTLNHDKIIDLAQEILGEIEVRNDYSGRGMFGKVSELAFVTKCHPNSERGKKFLQKTKMRTDNMGLTYIYYFS